MAALVLALSPATISPELAVTEAVVLFAGTLALIAINTVLLRRVFGPLDRLTVADAPGRPDGARAADRARPPGRRGRRAVRLVQRDARPARARAPRQRAPRAARPGGRAPPARARAARRGRPDADRRRAPARGPRADGAARSPSRSRSCRRPRATASRRCARSSRGLRPQALDEFGLRSALIALAGASPSAAGSGCARASSRRAGAGARAGPGRLPRRAGEPHQRRRATPAPARPSRADSRRDASCCASPTTAAGSATRVGRGRRPRRHARARAARRRPAGRPPPRGGGTEVRLEVPAG